MENRISLSRPVTPQPSSLLPLTPRPSLVRAARSLSNLQLQPSSFRSARTDSPLVRRESPPALSSPPTRAPSMSFLSPPLVPSARISLVQPSRSHRFGPRQILPAPLMRPARSKEPHCILPSARLTPAPSTRMQPTPAAPAAESLKFSQTDYEVPEENRTIMNKLVHQYRGLSAEYYLSNPLEQKVRNEFYAMRDNLLKNATAHLASIITSKTRPNIPELAINDSPHHWIKEIFKSADGIVLGEFHGDSASKKFLIKNMSFFKRQGIKTLYLEHLLSDLHRHDLELYFSSKTKKMPYGLKNYLVGLNRGFNIRSKYNFLELIKSAKNNDINVMAIDTAASYHTDEDTTPKNCRISMMNYYGQGVINNQQEKEPGKWVALVGNQHANTFEYIPGLAELTNGIGIRVKETPHKTAVIQQDKGEISLSASSSGPVMKYNFIRSDFVLLTPQKKELRLELTANDIEKRLKTGNFTIDREGSILIHRSRDGSIVKTPLNQDQDGNWFITKPDWRKINNKPYLLIQDLIKDLEDTMHMKLVYGL